MAGRFYIGVDLQEGFLSDRIRGSDYVRRVCEFLAGQDRSRVILTRFVNQPDSNFERLLDWPKMQAQDDETRLIGNLENQNFTIVQKLTYSSWVTEAKSRANELNCQQIVIFGLDAEACVLKTALDVFDAGLEPIVLADLCESSAGSDRNRTGLDLIASLTGVRQVIESSKLGGE